MVFLTLVVFTDGVSIVLIIIIIIIRQEVSIQNPRDGTNRKKIPKKKRKEKIYEYITPPPFPKRVSEFCNLTNMVFRQKPPFNTVKSFAGGTTQTNRQTDRLNWPRDRLSENWPQVQASPSPMILLFMYKLYQPPGMHCIMMYTLYKYIYYRKLGQYMYIFIYLFRGVISQTTTRNQLVSKQCSATTVTVKNCQIKI